MATTFTRMNGTHGEKDSPIRSEEVIQSPIYALANLAHPFFKEAFGVKEQSQRKSDC